MMTLKIVYGHGITRQTWISNLSIISGNSFCFYLAIKPPLKAITILICLFYSEFFKIFFICQPID